MEFSEEKRVVFLKKVLLSPKKGLQTFSEEAMDFSEHKIGIWGNFVLIPFRASDGNPTTKVGKLDEALVCKLEGIRHRKEHLFPERSYATWLRAASLTGK